jgi:hypothetical protein
MFAFSSVSVINLPSFLSGVTPLIDQIAPILTDFFLIT